MGLSANRQSSRGRAVEISPIDHEQRSRAKNWRQGKGAWELRDKFWGKGPLRLALSFRNGWFP